MEGVKKQKTIDEAYNYLSALCAGREYCIRDMLTKMGSWMITDGDEDDVVGKLVDNGFIDERRYASAFARDKFRYNKWGWVRIRMELRRRGIKDCDIDAAENEISSDDVTEMLNGLFETKVRTIEGRSSQEIKARLFRFALSKGFTYEQIEEVIDSFVDDD